MATTLSESQLRFTFDGDAVKFDETAYYESYRKYQPEGKGVDFISVSPDRIQMIEVKNCLGHEAENQWRIGKNNSSKAKRVAGQDETDRDSIDIEIAKKPLPQLHVYTAHGQKVRAVTSQKNCLDCGKI